MKRSWSEVSAPRAPSSARLWGVVLAALLPLGLAGQPLHAASMAAAEFGTIYDSLHGKVVLDNARYQAEQFVLEPGASTGRHSHPADQVLVFVKGGVLKSVDTGRSTLWRDGRVAWHSASEPADGGSTNVGTKPIVMMWVTLKPEPPGAASQDYPDGTPKDYHLNYPNIPGEDLLENERVVVQRFTVMPGQWEGVHQHLPNMLYIHITSGVWTGRTYKEAEAPEGPPQAAGEAGFMATIPLSVGHESHNVGKKPIELIWLTLKD